ncbi:MAG: signal transduction protein [Sphingomonadales bacterium]|nr:signal transduction protein [Sphingomonadales bacterium]MBD3775053.1 signal transduction protein [Paracoccaceae bacterium]
MIFPTQSRTTRLAALALAATPLALAIGAPPAAAQDGARMLEQMHKADANKDGAISRAELKRYRTSQFGRLDRNGDGLLSEADMPPFDRIRDMMQQQIVNFDANHDGRVSKAEFTNGPTTMFDMADTNHDGLVTEAELRKARAKIEQKAGK